MPRIREEDFKRNNAFTLYDLYGHAIAHGGHEIYNSGRPFLGHHYFIISLTELCLGVENKILREIMHFH